MVLAAGLGLRMRPLTEDRAKPTLSLMNRPLILHVLDHLAKHGIRKAVVNLHHQPERLRAIVESGGPEGLSIAFSEEPVVLGTAGGIRQALDHFDRGRPLLVVNADSFCDVSVSALWDVLFAGPASAPPVAALAVRPRREGEPYSPVHLDSSGRICGIGATGARGEPMTFLGVHVLTPEAIDRIPLDGTPDVVRDVYLPILSGGGTLGAHRHPGYWVEIGSPPLYLDAHMALLSVDRFMDGLDASSGRKLPGKPRSLAGAGCEGVDGASIEASVIGRGCRLGRGSAIVRSLVGESVVVGAGARIEDSVIWDGAEVPPGESVRSSLVLAPERAGGELRRQPLR
jgi:NDP-sugar pyrophosphorylase family protein